MRVVCREKWNDETPVEWSAAVDEIPVIGDLMEARYDREAKTNRERMEEGAVIRAFIVLEIKANLPPELLNDEKQSIAGVEFSLITAGDELVVWMNHRECCEKEYGVNNLSSDFDSLPTLINIQDSGFSVEVVE